MRSTITLFHFFVLVLITNAQPVLNSAEMLAPGTTTYMRFLGNFYAVDTTIQGPNAVWDFTGMEPDPQQPQFMMTIVDPSTTPNGSTFPTANYAYWEQPNNFYRYFNLTSTYMERVGSYTNGPYTFADPQREFVFPLTLGTANVDDWWGVADGGQYRLTCIGHGTLMVPGATLEDVLMVRAQVNGTLYALNMYFWYSSDDGRILMQFVQSAVVTQGLYYDGFAISVHENTAHKVSVLGNPVTTELNFVLGTSSEPLQYKVYSITGAVMSEGKIAGIAGTVESVNTAGYAPGVYMIQLLNDGSPSGEPIRFVKE